MKGSKLLFADETYAIRGALFEVYNEMGSGFLEAVYQECLVKEFDARGIPFREQQELRVSYKGELLQQKYIPDFLCYNSVLLEIKGVKTIGPEHRAQLLNYLKATGLEVGLLVNFGCASNIQVERFARIDSKTIRVNP